MLINREVLSKALREFIMAVDLNSDRLDTLIEANYTQLKGLADMLHIAKLRIDIVIFPSNYNLRGDEVHLARDFYDNAAPEEDSYFIQYAPVNNGSGSATLYPWAGYKWSAEELESIQAMGRILYIVYSRAGLLNNANRSDRLDLMTGLLNNRGLLVSVGEMQAKGVSLDEYTCIFMNLKNFKLINKTIGNREGDRLLIQFGHTLFGLIDDDERAARLGGDNFVLLLKNEHVDKFRAFIEDYSILSHKNNEDKDPINIRIDARMGIYHAKRSDTMSSILQKAGFAFEVSRRSAVDVVTYHHDMQVQAMHQRWVSTVFPEALQKNEIVPYYQPKVHLDSRKLCGAEALVRWIRDGKIVPPSDFIPFIESESLITVLDQYMLKQVCIDLRRWIDRGIEPVRVSVNFSRRDFLEKDLAERTLATLDEYRIDGKYIEIEVTESSFYEDFEALNRFTEMMHARGVHVSMDDFGTGYSSLNMFQHLDFDVVKLDKSFVDNLGKGNSKDEIVVESIATMLTKLKTDMVAEGVETGDQLERVKDINCNIIQGYYFDKPLPHDVFENRLQNRVYA